MSDAAKDYILRFGGEDATGPAFDEIIARAKEAGAKISTQLNKGMGGGGKPEWMESLKDQFGRESAFGGLGEILRGGGALIGITAATEAIKGLAEGAEKVKQDFYDSDKNVADMAQDLMQSIPVLGSIEQAGAAINELFTGEQEALKRATDDAADLDKELIVNKQLIKEGAAYYHDIEETIKRIKAHTAEIGMPAFEKGQIETSSSASQQKDALDKSLHDQIEKYRADAKPDIDKLKDKIKEQQARIAKGFAISIPVGPGMAPAVGEDTDAKRDAMDRLASLEHQKGALEKNRDEQIGKATSGTNSEKAAIDADMQKQIQQQQKGHDRQMVEDARQSAIEHTASIAEQGAAEMQLHGHFLDANIAQVRASADKEIAELRLSSDKKQDDLKKGSREWLAIEADATQKSADIRKQASEKEAEARRKDQEYDREQIQRHAQEIIDTQAETRDKGLRAVGKTFEADREQLERQHNDRIAKIKADAQTEIDAHGERKDEIQKRAQESINAENQSYAVGSLAEKIEAMKNMGPINMSASASGGVGYDANALAALAAPIAAKEEGWAAVSKGISAMNDMMAKILAAVKEPTNFRINFTP